MSIVKLDPKVRKKVEAELNVQIPTPDEEAFEGFLESLQISQPELHRELILGLSVTKMPAEKEAAKAARRTRFRKLIDRLFFLTKWPDNRVLDKKRVVYAGLGALAVLLPAAYLLSSNYLRIGQDRQSEVPVGTAENSSALGGVGYVDASLEVEDPTQGVATWLLTSSQETPRPTETPPTPDSSERTFRPFPSDLPPPAAPVPSGVAVPPASLLTDSTQLPSSAPPPSQLSVTSLSQEPQQITVWERASTADIGGGMGVPANFEVVNLSSRPPQAIAAFEREEQVAPMTLEGQAQGESPTALPSQTKHPARLTVFTRETGSQLISVSESNREKEGLNSSPDNLTAQIQTSPASPASEEASAVDAKGETQTTQAVANTVLQPGTGLPATLATGITVTAQASLPVVAETKGDWCGESQCPDITWIGTASLPTSERVEVEFTEAVIGTETQAVTAVALGDDESVGLAVSTQDAASDVAQDLLQGAAGGVSDYLEALVNQKQITFQDGAVIQEGQVPGIETFILGRFAELISPPTTSVEQVKVASVPAGTAFTILYGVDSSD